MARSCPSWVSVNVLFILLRVTLSHHSDPCVTKDGRDGLCVPHHYCREASRIRARVMDTCTIDDDEKDVEEHVCCPFPKQKEESSETASSISPRIISSSRSESNSSRRNIPTRSTTSPRPEFSTRETTDYYEKNSRPTQQTRESHRPSDSRELYPLSAVPSSSNRGQTVNDRKKESERTLSKPSSTASPKSEGCGQKPYVLFIAGGEESKAHSWPWMTAIFRRFHSSSPSTFICGGSLINNRYVLTAAHCFINNRVILPASSFFVRLGSHDLDIGEDYSVQSLVIHPNYTETSYVNDIAVLRLSSVVYFTDKIAPLCLPHQGLLGESFVGKFAIVAGWGDAGFGGRGSTQVLNEVKIPVVSNEDCALAYSRIKRMAFLMRGTNHILCAGLKEGGRDACLGDSGGPLMVKTEDRWTIIGIVSLGYKCAEPDYPGVYTRVTHYLPWIYANMGKS